MRRVLPDKRSELGVYGFTLSFLHTKKERYLDTAEKVADYFIPVFQRAA